MKFGPAHKPESERALWPAASSGGAWNSLLGSEPLERRDLDRFGSEDERSVYCLWKDQLFVLTPEILGCVLDFSAACESGHVVHHIYFVPHESDGCYLG